MLIIKNGNIHTGNGKILKKHDILINNENIKKIKENVEVAEDIEVIAADNKEVFPGFIDPLSSIGSMDRSFSIKDHNEISDPLTPEAKIKYAFNHSEVMFEELYKVGITTIGATPGNTNVIGGQMAAYKTWGQNSSKMLVKEPVALKGAVGNLVKKTYGEDNKVPKTRMMTYKLLKEIFNKVNKKIALGEENSEKEKNKVIKKVLKQKLPLFITANKSFEIENLIHSLREFDIDLTICGGYQVDQVLDLVREKGIPLIIGELIYLTAKNYNNTDLYKIAQLQKNDIPVSFTLTGRSGTSGKVMYLWNAIEFYKAGLESEEVLKLMTINPAKILGLEEELGSIEEGKKADIVIYDDNPIKYYQAQVSHTLIKGKLAYERGAAN